MHSEAGFRRLVNFSDAVVAIAITLLILPLVDSASNIGSATLGHFLAANRPKLLAFFLSFFVIGRFWWAQHVTFERLRSYNTLLVSGMFLWLISIVFLPFPTELLGVSSGGLGVHALYIGTLLVAAVSGLIQVAAAVRNSELQVEGDHDLLRTDAYLSLSIVTAVAFVVALAVPSIGLWALLALALQGPLEHLMGRRHGSARSKQPKARS
jgi:uncharacterized membrane protein